MLSLLDIAVYWCLILWQSEKLLPRSFPRFLARGPAQLVRDFVDSVHVHEDIVKGLRWLDNFRSASQVA